MRTLIWRRRPVAPATWQPARRPPESASGYTADFRDSAGPNAFGVTFTLKGHPGATLTLWTYVAHGPGGKFRVGYRYDHRLAARDLMPVRVRIRNHVGDWDFSSLQDADDNARWQAQFFARPSSPPAAAEHLPWCFAWDGEPW
jgi:hypothetical protein